MEEAAPDFNVGAKGSSGPTEEWILKSRVARS